MATAEMIRPTATVTQDTDVFFALTDLIINKIQVAVMTAAGLDEEKRREAAPLIRTAVNIVAGVRPIGLLDSPDADMDCNEMHVVWENGEKQLILMCFPARGPLLHQYERVPGRPSQHSIADATSDKLSDWLRWLHE